MVGVRLVVMVGLPTTYDPVSSSHLNEAMARASKIRFQFETHFALGVPSKHSRVLHVPVVSGNFVIAQPRGVINGEDFLNAGVVRRIRGDDICELLDLQKIVLVTPIGHSTTGRSLLLDSYDLATAISTSVSADKLVLFDEHEWLVDSDQQVRRDLSTAELERILGEGTYDLEYTRRLNMLLASCRAGVDRSHLISYHREGALLEELFTPDGCGTQVSDKPYRVIRKAETEDIQKIHLLIEPYELEGQLRVRGIRGLEKELSCFWIAELDDAVVGCFALYPRQDQMAELGCVVTASTYRDLTLGRDLLHFAEHRARSDGIETLYVLTTQAIDWFVEQGFKLASADSLPGEAAREIDERRNPKVLIKKIGKNA